MKFDPRELGIFALIVFGAFGLGLLLNAGHFLWPMVVIIGGAYIIPTIFVKIRNLYAHRRYNAAKGAEGPDSKPV